jgi:hypothetical protein
MTWYILHIAQATARVAWVMMQHFLAYLVRLTDSLRSRMSVFRVAER